MLRVRGIIICYVFKLLQGRALLNAVGNLELSGAYTEALKKLGHNLEDVATQVRFTDHLIELCFHRMVPDHFYISSLQLPFHFPLSRLN